MGLIRSWARARWLRVLAVIALVSVVVFSNPMQATAASGWVEANPTTGWGLDGGRCWIALSQDPSGAAINIANGARCISMASDRTPGYSQHWEAGAGYEVVVDGLNAAGAQCGGATGGSFGDHPSNGTKRVAGSIPGGTAAIPLAGGGDGGCHVTEVCIVSIADDFAAMGGGNRMEACDDIDLDPYEAPQTACPYGTPTAKLTIESQPDGDYILDVVQVRWSLKGRPFPGSERWGAAIKWPGGGNWQSDITSGNQHATNRSAWRHKTQSEMGIPQPISLEVWAYPDPANPPWNGAPPNEAQALTVPETYPLTQNSGYHGVTDPTRCRFYFGQKILNFPDTDIDNPQGDGMDDPDPEQPTGEEPPPPVDEEPDDEGTNWLYLIWLALTGLAKAIASAIGSLLNALVEGVLDGLLGLFVPRDGFYQDVADDVSDAFEGTTIDNYVTVFKSMVPTGASGCQGPSFNIPVFGASGGNNHPLSACGGAAATAATATRVAVSISVGMSTVFACVRILGRALGWDPGLGNGASS